MKKVSTGSVQQNRIPLRYHLVSEYGLSRVKMTLDFLAEVALRRGFMTLMGSNRRSFGLSLSCDTENPDSFDLGPAKAHRVRFFLELKADFMILIISYVYVQCL